MTQTEQIKLLAQAIGTDIAVLKSTIGFKSDLTTEDTTNLVAAINELVTKIQAVEALQQSASEIDDSDPKANRVYSSNKVTALIEEIKSLIGPITTTGYSDVTSALSTLADKVVTLEQKAVDLTELIKDTEKEATSVWSSAKTDDAITAAVDAAKSELKSELTDKIIEDVAKVKSDILGEGVPETLDTLKEIADSLNGDATLVANLSVALNNRVRFDEEQVLSSEQKTRACNNIGIGEPNTDFVIIYDTAKFQVY